MTIRVSNFLAVGVGVWGLFNITSAHASPSLGSAFKANSAESIVVRAGFYSDDRCFRPLREHREHCERHRWRPRRFAVRPERPHFIPRPYFGSNYEVYTYRRPYDLPPRTDVQMVYGWYRGYYHPFPHYPRYRGEFDF